MQEIQFGKVDVDGIGNVPFTYVNRTKTVSFDGADTDIVMSYNQVRYLSGMIKSMCQYHGNSKVVRLGTRCTIIPDKDPKVVKINKIKVRL